MFINIDIDNKVIGYYDYRKDLNSIELLEPIDIARLNAFPLVSTDGRHNFKYLGNNRIGFSDSFDETEYDLSNYKTEIIKLLDTNAYNHIVELGYPMWRQQQINNYNTYEKWTEQDYIDMHTTIKSVISSQDTKKQSILDATTITAIESVDISF